MKKTNYTKFMNSPVNEEVTEEIVETVEEDTVDCSPVEEVELEETVTTEPEEELSKVGNVKGCTKLRVREKPSTDGVVICEIAENSVVIINEKESTEDFYKVITEAGAEGYCMKKFVTV